MENPSSVTVPPLVTLMGDSILDNRNYASPCVTEQLIAKTIAKKWNVEIVALDGALLHSIPGQMEKTSKSTTHIVLSIGGNNCLCSLSDISSRGLLSTYSILRETMNLFRTKYATYLDNIKSEFPEARIIGCNIYHPCFTQSRIFQMIATAGLYFINNIIKEECVKRSIPMIDVATIFDSWEDYANPIEPSEKGGDKISNNIIDIVEHHDFNGPAIIYQQKIYSSTPYEEMKKIAKEYEEKHTAINTSEQNEKFRSM